MMKGRGLKITLSVMVTGVFIYLIITNVPLKQISGLYAQLSLKTAIISLFAHLLGYLFRSLSIWVILRTDHVRFSSVALAHGIHNLYVHLVPVSLGELSFPYLIRNNTNFSKSLSALFISRVFQFAIFFGILLIGFLFLPEISSKRYMRKGMNGLLIIAAVALVIFVLFRRFGNKLTLRFSNSMVVWIANKLDKIKTEMLHQTSKIKINVHSLLIFLGSLLSILCISVHFSNILTHIGIQLTYWEILFNSSIGLIFIIIPIKSIGGFGTVEGAWTIGLTLFGITLNKAIEASLFLHLITLQNVIIIFAISQTIKFIINRKSN